MIVFVLRTDVGWVDYARQGVAEKSLVAGLERDSEGLSGYKNSG
jgi:hypothetical protein